MSATAFQRMRREAAAKKVVKEKAPIEPNNKDVPPINTSEDIKYDIQKQDENTDISSVNIVPDEQEKSLNNMTVEELMAYAEKNNIDTGKATSQAE